jgi:hypothetical protein
MPSLGRIVMVVSQPRSSLVSKHTGCFQSSVMEVSVWVTY